MRRTDRYWGRIQSVTAESARCPLCRFVIPMIPGCRRYEPVLPWHTESNMTHSLRCDGSGKTLKAARELDALRQRPHP